MTDMKYYLFLDESGDFWEDNPSNYVSPSLIGGVLYQKEELTDDDFAKQVHSSMVLASEYIIQGVYADGYNILRLYVRRHSQVVLTVQSR